jgi:4-carboxymuconolactone decarboxylase
MARIPLVTRAAVPQKERAAYDAFSANRGSEPRIGPYSIIAHMPELAQRLEALRTCVRKEASLSQTLQEHGRPRNELRIHLVCSCGRGAEGRGARRHSRSHQEKQALTGLAPEQQTVVNFTRELLQTRMVGKATFEAATVQFGQRGTMTLINLIACYAVLAYNMNTYELEAPAHATEPALPA